MIGMNEFSWSEGNILGVLILFCSSRSGCLGGSGLTWLYIASCPQTNKTYDNITSNYMIGMNEFWGNMTGVLILCCRSRCLGGSGLTWLYIASCPQTYKSHGNITSNDMVGVYEFWVNILGMLILFCSSRSGCFGGSVLTGLYISSCPDRLTKLMVI